MKKLRKSFIVCILIALPAAYTLWDMRQARSLAAHASELAVPGRQVEEYLSALSQGEYRIIRSGSVLIIVPRRGMGRYRCMVQHDGRFITGSNTGSMD